MIRSLTIYMHKWIDKLESKKQFTPSEAWKLFRLAALSEAIGWSILILGILIKYYNLPGHTIALPIAGQIHGMIFIAYFMILLLIYSSLQWNLTKVLISFCAGVIPYGSLLFEIVESKARKKLENNQISISVIIHKNKTILAVQPSHGIEWALPTWTFSYTKNPKQKITQTIINVFGLKNEDCKLVLMHSNEQNNYVYRLVNSGSCVDCDLVQAAKLIPFVDELSFVNRNTAPNLFAKLPD